MNRWGIAGLMVTLLAAGCVRVPIHSSAWLFDNVPNGTPVYLIGGKNPAVPFPPPAPAPAAEPAPAPAPVAEPTATA